MQNRMAVWTNGPEIRYRIDNMFSAMFGQRSQMMDVNESIGDFTVFIDEIELADSTNRSVGCDAEPSSFWITLVSVDRDRFGGSFINRFEIRQFIWITQWGSDGNVNVCSRKASCTRKHFDL